MLATLAALSTQFTLRVTAFGDSAPGGPRFFREVTVASDGGGTGAARLSAALATSSQGGWVRIAHLSPEAPAMDIYLYPFGDPAHPTVLRDVSYGDVSAYMALAPGQYTVAMRGFDAPASSHPALVSSFMVSAKTAYTVAALGPDPGGPVRGVLIAARSRRWPASGADR